MIAWLHQSTVMLQAGVHWGGRHYVRYCTEHNPILAKFIWSKHSTSECWMLIIFLGCKERFQCCKISLSSRVAGCRSRYDCCNLKANSKGCKKVCKKCDKPWGSDAHGCFEKPHNVIELISKDEENEDTAGIQLLNNKDYQRVIWILAVAKLTFTLRKYFTRNGCLYHSLRNKIQAFYCAQFHSTNYSN